MYERGTLADGTSFYAMRLVRGRTLAQAIHDATTLEERLKLVPAIVRVAQTLGFAHERGVVHRDIKPDNIIVGRHGEAVVLDWGIAKVRGVAMGDADPGGALKEHSKSGATEHGSVIGTPAYMPPEQAAGNVDAVDERTDVWALGALLYQLLAGRGPYEDASIGNVLARATTADFVPIDAAAREAPESLRLICTKAMSLAPTARYQTANEFADALEMVAANALVGKDSTTVRYLAAAITAGAIVASLGTMWFVWEHVGSIRDQGTMGLVVPWLGFAGCITSVVEWKTKGKYALAPLSLALIIVVVLAGLGGAVADAEEVLHAALNEPVIANADRYRRLLTEGLFESLGILGVATSIASIQAMLWGTARRTVLRVQRQRTNAQQ